MCDKNHKSYLIIPEVKTKTTKAQQQSHCTILKLLLMQFTYIVQNWDVTVENTLK
jgi:hypothetical protein